MSPHRLRNNASHAKGAKERKEREMGTIDLEPVIADIVDAAVKLHIRVGPGLLESVYEAILARSSSGAVTV